jgi:hypothetical protein
MHHSVSVFLPDTNERREFVAEQDKKMQQRGGRPLERSCHSLNENVTRLVLIKSRAERGLDDGAKRALIVLRIQFLPISNWHALGTSGPACQDCATIMARRESFTASSNPSCGVFVLSVGSQISSSMAARPPPTHTF